MLGVVAFTIGRFFGALSDHQAKLMALREGLQLAVRYGLWLSNMECDAVNVVFMINSKFVKSMNGVIV